MSKNPLPPLAKGGLGGIEEHRVRVKNICMRCVFVLSVLMLSSTALGADPPKSDAEPAEPTISVSENMGEAIAKEAEQVRQDLQKQVITLSRWTPLGWDFKTIDYISQWMLKLPLRVPELMQQVMVHGRVLGVAGSLVMLTFLTAVFYSIFGRHRVMRRIEAAIQPVRHRIPDPLYPFFLAGLRVVTAAAIPLLLLAVYSGIDAMITYRAAWFTLTGRLLGLWSLAALAIGLLREILTRDLFKVTAAHGKKVFQIARLVLLYILIGIILYWGAEAFSFP